MEKKKIIYALPLLGILAGTVGARLALITGIADGLLARARELPLGPGILSGDNLTLYGGLLGISIATLIAGRMARRLAGHEAAHDKDNGKADA
jgi:hypothetical protein